MPRRAKVIRRRDAAGRQVPQHRTLADVHQQAHARRQEEHRPSASCTTLWTMIEAQTHRNPLDTFDQALRNATPVVEVKPRRVGGATYQVPVDIRAERQALAGDALAPGRRPRPQRPLDGREAGGGADGCRQRPGRDDQEARKTPTAWRRPTAPSSTIGGSHRVAEPPM